MKNLLAAGMLGITLSCAALHGEERFGRPVIALENPKDYEFYKLDDVKFPLRITKKSTVSCLVYRGTERYYVEIAIQNKTETPVTLVPGFVEFDKPGYTVFETDPAAAASELASVSGLRYVPIPPTQMPASTTTTTTLNANATTFGNMTQVNGTAVSTTTDTSGQAGANFGNALGNAIAARRFYRAQRDAVGLSQYLTSFGWKGAPVVVQPGKAQIVILTFQQTKRKKAHFQVLITVGDEIFNFKYKE